MITRASGLPPAVDKLVRKPQPGDDAPLSPDKPEWIQRSDRATQKLLDIQFADSPEAGSAQGVSQYDSLVSVPTRERERITEFREMALQARLEARLEDEKDEHVRQDYQILLGAIHQDLSAREYAEGHSVGFRNPFALVMDGLSTLLDDQTPPERRQAAVDRLRKYAGLEPGYQPICDVLRERMQSQMDKGGMIYPSRREVETALARDGQIADGMQALLEKSGVTGWQEPLGKLKEQLTAHDAWVREALLPHAREDFRLTPQAYQRNFEAMGITDVSPDQLATRAHQAFSDIQAEMGEVAKRVAAEKHLPSSDYHDVMRALKAEQVSSESILPLYKERLRQVEGIIRDRDLVRLPEGEAVIRLATESEAAQVPAPQMIPPPLVNNTGQKGQFVLPLVSPDGQKFDDFTYDAIAWTVTAHEARPGHELQFDTMVDQGVSKARAIFAANSANIEGWGLYSEWLIQPDMPAEGQLASLDGRLLRAARAFLDPELHSGKISIDQARHILADEVLLSPAMVDSEIQRYTTMAPAQACSYFYGYNALRELRADTEKAAGANFSPRQFHDFILDQGLLPPRLLREAVESHFAAPPA